jgi:hypothetical protein
MKATKPDSPDGKGKLAQLDHVLVNGIRERQREFHRGALDRLEYRLHLRFIPRDYYFTGFSKLRTSSSHAERRRLEKVSWRRFSMRPGAAAGPTRQDTVFENRPAWAPNPTNEPRVLNRSGDCCGKAYWTCQSTAGSYIPVKSDQWWDRRSVCVVCQAAVL